MANARALDGVSRTSRPWPEARVLVSGTTRMSGFLIRSSGSADMVMRKEWTHVRRRARNLQPGGEHVLVFGQRPGMVPQRGHLQSRLARTSEAPAGGAVRTLGGFRSEGLPHQGIQTARDPSRPPWKRPATPLIELWHRPATICTCGSAVP